MKKYEFLNRLEVLLQSIPAAEREEALQYYRDYFEDADAENEEEVIASLGTPEDIAYNLKKEFAGSTAAKHTPEDAALINYGRTEEKQSERERQYERQEYNSYAGAPGQPGQPGKSGMSAAVIVLLILASPILLGLFGALFGVVVAVFSVWFAIVVTAAACTIAFFAAAIALLFVGVKCFFVSPIAGMALIGASCICGALTILFLMASVGLIGSVTPAFFKGIGKLFTRRKKEALA